jgi:DNA-binding HxlR family transcriptional regulator
MGATAPRPGSPVRGSSTGRPLMAAMDLLGQRWTLRILWELRDGPLGARMLQDRCDQMSSSVLYERLRQLSDARLVDGGGGRAYALTNLGRSLGAALQPLDEWAKRWSAATSTHRIAPNK